MYKNNKQKKTTKNNEIRDNQKKNMTKEKIRQLSLDCFKQNA